MAKILTFYYIFYLDTSRCIASKIQILEKVDTFTKYHLITLVLTFFEYVTPRAPQICTNHLVIVSVYRVCLVLRCMKNFVLTREEKKLEKPEN